MTAVVQRPHARVKLLESECQFYHFSAVPPHGTHLDIVFYFAQKLLDCVDGKVAAFLRARSHHLSSRTAEFSTNQQTRFLGHSIHSNSEAKGGTPWGTWLVIDGILRRKDS
ncbi:uncharacterized protein LOC144242536 isoform X1 [Crocuta crocuta]